MQGYLDIGALQHPDGGSPSANTGYLDLGALQHYAPAPSAVLSGTFLTATESEIVAGGKTIVITLTDETFIPS